jgi:hypothetical protein
VRGTCIWRELLLTLRSGPNWIYGTIQNPLFKIAAETKTVTYALGALHSIFDSHGKSMGSEDAKEQYRMVWDILDDAFQYSSSNSKSIPSSLSLMDFFRDKVQDSNLTDEIRGNLLQIVQMWGAFTGTAVEKQSLKFFWLEKGIDSGM